MLSRPAMLTPMNRRGDFEEQCELQAFRDALSFLLDNQGRRSWLIADVEVVVAAPSDTHKIDTK